MSGGSEKLKKEFQHLFEEIEKQNMPMEAFVQRTIHLFEKVDREIAAATAEDKRELHAMLSVVQGDLRNKLNQLTLQTGLDGQQMQAVLENPNNFSPQQWHDLEKGRSQLSKLIGSIPHHLSEKPSLQAVQETGEVPHKLDKLRRAEKRVKKGWQKT